MNRMNLFDSHCHLDDPSYQSDLDTVLDRARAAGRDPEQARAEAIKPISSRTPRSSEG